MTSNINYLSINENFPVAGQDNDTQVFRDNFDVMKNNFRYTKEDIETLQNNTAKLNADNDFELNTVRRAIFQNNRDKKFDAGIVPLVGADPSAAITIDYENGPYQIFRLDSNVNMDTLNFPGDPALTSESGTVGKATIELYSTGSSHTITFLTSGGTVIKKDPSFPATLTVSSSTNPVLIEIWRHSSSNIYMRYLGQFS